MNLEKAQIIAEKGPIVIGNDNLIEEGVIIKNSNEETLYVGNENIFEVQSQFEGDLFSPNDELKKLHYYSLFYRKTNW